MYSSLSLISHISSWYMITPTCNWPRTAKEGSKCVHQKPGCYHTCRYKAVAAPAGKGRCCQHDGHMCTLTAAASPGQYQMHMPVKGDTQAAYKHCNLVCCHHIPQCCSGWACATAQLEPPEAVLKHMLRQGTSAFVTMSALTARRARGLESITTVQQNYAQPFDLFASCTRHAPTMVMPGTDRFNSTQSREPKARHYISIPYKKGQDQTRLDTNTAANHTTRSI